MRTAAAIASAALLALALAVPAGSYPHRGECHKLTQQMARYERDFGWAEERGNALWAQSNLRQIERLEDRRDRLCPHLREASLGEKVGSFLVDALTLAGKAAKTAFTLGML